MNFVIEPFDCNIWSESALSSHICTLFVRLSLERISNCNEIDSVNYCLTTICVKPFQFPTISRPLRFLSFRRLLLSLRKISPFLHIPISLLFGNGLDILWIAQKNDRSTGNVSGSGEKNHTYSRATEDHCCSSAGARLRISLTENGRQYGKRKRANGHDRPTRKARRIKMKWTEIADMHRRRTV